MSAAYVDEVSVTATVAVAETVIPFDVAHIVFVTNDGTEDVLIRFTQASAYMLLRAGETLNDVPLRVRTLGIKAQEGTTGGGTVRALGVI